MRPPLYRYAVSSTVYSLSLSLFKKLFNFPSRYLFAIGLVLEFSLGWILPITLGCIPTQSDSKVDLGTIPSAGLRVEWKSRELTQTPNFLAVNLPGFGADLIPLHSPLLGESWLVSFPPLSDMLKFSM
ncbi:unnamed protein product [Schistocephalus solidus]|uniref:Uncharacterized protein n=1 Tax=Schistocephalus solidus TaxID=70667 RepID=A0A3P7ENB6_SCHSO|nr:unnamed protein product [Schistocephalus solidus]